MARIVVMNDPHYSVHQPQCRSESYPHEILDKFHRIGALALKVGAVGIGCTGDWFHRKGKVTFREGNDLLAVLSGWKKVGLDVFGILGNHDIAGHRLDSLDNRAVGSLVHSKALHLLDHEVWTCDGLAVTGTSYFHGCDGSDESRVKMYGAVRPDGCDVHVHLAHGTLVQRGTFFEDFTVAADLIGLLHDNGVLPDVIVCGHLHYDEGIRYYDRPDGGKVAVCRIGSLGRVSSDDFDRIPKALVIANSGEKFACKAVEVGRPVRSPQKVAGCPDPDEHEQRVKDFVRNLREEADDWSVVDHGAVIRRISDEMGYESDIAEFALTYVERRQ